MNETMTVAVINLVAKVGFDAAIALLENMKSAKTIDDAIAALEKSRQLTWQKAKDEA